MLGYTTIGTNDLPRAQQFYDALLGGIGARRLMEFPDEKGFTFYGTGFDRPMLGVTPPYDGQPASVGNGTMIALQMPDRKAVDRLYAHALELGARCEGAPGVRSEEMGFYAAYFRDLDGNKLCAFHAQGG